MTVEEPLVRSNKITMVKLSDIKLNPKNRNTHPPEQINELVKLITYQGFRRPVTISKLSGFLSCGEGRYLAAKKIGMSEIPAMFQDYADAAMEYADGIADNAIDKWAFLDTDAIKQDLIDFGPDFDMDWLGLQDPLFGEAELADEAGYSAKIESPIYTPKGDKPALTAIYDTSKARKLIKEIDQSKDLTDDEKDFLRFAAYRHVVFNYENAAEYYSHADKKIQDLMEKSALVIIDFKKAIENGFVVLSEKIAQEYTNEG